jgi:2-polyprenyl-6-methoxyphenol hydroxylase-like FAD-dependent oxidoreductase
VGAAVHLAPNSNGILRRWGIFAEEFGGNPMNHLLEYNETGLVKEMDLTIPNKMWQHPWHLVHRVSLHEKLKEVATSDNGPGVAPTLQTSSRVVEVDPEAGRVIFEDGSSIDADVVIGADGIYVRTD